MADFNTAVAMVLKHEGGYVWNLNDPGGPTNFGITEAVYSGYIKRIATPDDVKKMTVDAAKDIYRRQYWAAIRGDEIACQGLANHLLDMSVLRGVGNGIKTMQTVLGVPADGVFGSKSVAALNANNAATVLNLFRSFCVKAFANIVTARPASLEFLTNWVRRAEEMTDTVSVLCQKTDALVSAAGARPQPAKT